MTMAINIKRRIVAGALYDVMMLNPSARNRILLTMGTKYYFLVDAIKNNDELTIEHISIALQLSNYAHAAIIKEG